jgi:hypothetical protein
MNGTIDTNRFVCNACWDDFTAEQHARLRRYGITRYSRYVGPAYEGFQCYDCEGPADWSTTIHIEEDDDE